MSPRGEPGTAATLESVTARNHLRRAHYITSALLYFLRDGGLAFWAGRGLVLTNKAFIKNPNVRFFVSSVRSLRRVKFAHLKEPMTQRWIHRMDASDCLWDVGANIGIFSLLAASRGVRVVAIEPLLGNFYDFQRTLDLNPDLSLNVTPILAGLSHFTGPETLASPSTTAGYSGAQLGKMGDELGGVFVAPISRQVMAFRGDALLSLLERDSSATFHPTHIKIDVDGIELEILRGLSKILTSDRIKSLLLETGPSQWGDVDEIEDFLYELGFVASDSEPTTRTTTIFFNKIYQRRGQAPISL